MPLTDFQARIAKLLAGNRNESSHLAGRSAIHIEPNSIRYSNGLDYFNDSDQRVVESFTLDEKSLINVLAFVGRNEARDFLDVMDIHKKVLPLPALCWAAAGKDPGLNPRSIVELLKRIGRFRQEDLDRLHFGRPGGVMPIYR
jgi:hypothetical protein